MKTVTVDGHGLTIEDVHLVAREGARVELSDKAKEAIEKSNALVKKLVDSGEAIYGVTTGIGEFARIRIAPEMGEELQRKIIYSHSAGTGDPQPIEVVRAGMLLRVNTLSRGNSGVRLVLVQTMVDMINKGVHPFVYQKGSVGASGDLSPLSQVAEVVLGEGRAYYKGELMEGGEAMKKAGIEPIRPTYKEGLGIINGSQILTGQSALILYDAERLLKNAMIASAMTLDALKAVLKAYDPRLHGARPFPGQNAVAQNLRALFDGSEIIADPTGKVQDGYSMRCTPQVLGPSLDAFHYARRQIETEMNSSVDNPLFFPEDGDHVAGGNFHAQSVGMAMDFLGIAMAEVASLSERHTNRLLNPVLSGLPDFLVEGRGVNSGLMVAQYTAAALVSENKVLAHPGVVDSISVSADQEDHVSMAPVSVHTCQAIIKNVQSVLAIEMLAACQAFDFRKPKKPGKGTAVAYNIIREKVSFMEEDRPLHPDIDGILELIRDNSVLDAVEKEMGTLLLTMEMQ